MNKLVLLTDLRPSNWFLNKVKVESIRYVWNKGQQNTLPPVLISEIDAQLALIDGNTRAFVAWEKGQKLISAIQKELSEIDNNELLYKYLHRRGPKNGIVSICNLAGRILEPKDY